MQITRAPGKNACPNENSALFGRVLSARTIMYELLICFKWFFVLASIIECDMQRIAFEFWQFSGIVTYSHRSSNGRSRSLIPHSLRILCSFFHLRTKIIKNNLHLLFFLLFALFSCILFSTHTHTETAFLFIYLLSAVFFCCCYFIFLSLLCACFFVVFAFDVCAPIICICRWYCTKNAAVFTQANALKCVSTVGR